jgi:hypothetical protein
MGAVQGDWSMPCQVVPGSQPSNTLLIERITPANLGMLLALYEHKARRAATAACALVHEGSHMDTMPTWDAVPQ